MDLGLKPRTDILSGALFIETTVSAFLGNLLGIKDVKISKSLGNKATALSFNQKVNLLLDINALKKEDQQKFIVFMEIRNQFMHNLEAKTYESCFSFLEGRDRYALKLYPQSSKLSREKQLEAAVSNLMNEVLKTAIGIWEKVKEKISKDVESKVTNKMYRALLNSIGMAQKLIEDYIEKEIAKEAKYTAKQWKGFGTFVGKLIFNYAQNEFDRLTKEEIESSRKSYAQPVKPKK